MTSTITSPDGAPALSRGRDFGVRDRVVVITGAGQGIGREYAREFAAAGAIPVLAEINGAAARNVAAEIEQAGGRSLVVETDVADPASTEAMVERVVAELGRVDALINNAAIFSSLQMRPFDQIPLDEWDAVLRVNVTGAFLCARAVVPHMKAAGWGRIVNIMSGSVPLGIRNYLHYVTSKSALVGMTNSLARELGADGITVNAVQPGGTFTEVPRNTVTPEGKAALIANQCIPREEVPMDLVGLVLFLCTPAAGFITGQTIACDGGLTHH
ncbi:3-oxoacyl-[acyl-carrier protein] reductase [Pseudonocardia thermophila]|jgi:Dehydrogenases with different specificities (related to short-chain alcohol dehydrogenases)|uniref:3-oxoacyl-[acyl-carrier protein] reductase n=1 Tax=Pseudonocardia thermophila TaxID=1848 RepID=A0A1M6PQ63_PSETH|nr:SDR family oxidoreductase [Pseudonocardia thermophila]SHK10011.1 3-oxoacyl-[acyl-carrier protein] reductase [Pseudonocardia thermophila]